MKLKIAKCRDVRTPERGTPGSAGYDFFVPTGMPDIIMTPGSRVKIPSGIKVNLQNFRKDSLDDVDLDSFARLAFIAHNKSSISHGEGLVVTASVVDEDYQGEIHLCVLNTNPDKSVTIKAGSKLVQLIILPVLVPILEEVSEEQLFIEKTSRGDNGFGSTGV